MNNANVAAHEPSCKPNRHPAEKYLTSRNNHAEDRVVRGWNYNELASRAKRAPGLSTGARLVLQALVCAADSNVASRSYRTVCRTLAWLQYDTGQSERHVRRCLRAIEATGILVLQRVGTNIDVERANVWTFHPERLTALTNAAEDAWRNRKTQHELVMEKARAEVLATNDAVHAALAEHYGQAIDAPANDSTMPPKSTRRYATKATNPRIGLHHAVADHRARRAHDDHAWSNDHVDPVRIATDPVRDDDKNVPLSGVTLPVDLAADRNHGKEQDHLVDDQRAPAHVHTYDKWLDDQYADHRADHPEYDEEDPVMFDDSTPVGDIVDRTNVIAGGYSLDVADTLTEDPAVECGAVDQGDDATTTQEPVVIASDPEAESTTKKIQPTPPDQYAAATPQLRTTPHAAVLAQKAPKNATQARQWSSSMFTFATGHHDPVAATVALVIASTWNAVGEYAMASSDPAVTMARATGERGRLELRFAVPVGDVIDRVTEAWWLAEADNQDGPEYPGIDALEVALHLWFTERGKRNRPSLNPSMICAGRT